VLARLAGLASQVVVCSCEELLLVVINLGIVVGSV
jgi:hypothetical protein